MDFQGLREGMVLTYPELAGVHNAALLRERQANVVFSLEAISVSAGRI
jgi:hypothetical protein